MTCNLDIQKELGRQRKCLRRWHRVCWYLSRVSRIPGVALSRRDGTGAQWGRATGASPRGPFVFRATQLSAVNSFPPSPDARVAGPQSTIWTPLTEEGLRGKKLASRFLADAIMDIATQRARASARATLRVRRPVRDAALLASYLDLSEPIEQLTHAGQAIVISRHPLRVKLAVAVGDEYTYSLLP